jgi:hypothetical protein
MIMIWCFTNATRAEWMKTSVMRKADIIGNVACRVGFLWSVAQNPCFMSGSGSEIKHSVIQTFRTTEKPFYMPETLCLIMTHILNYSGGQSSQV